MISKKMCSECDSIGSGEPLYCKICNGEGFVYTGNCEHCAHAVTKMAALLFACATGEHPSWDDCECGVGNHELFPDKGDECIDFIPSKYLED